jgi:hypothetical protein
MAGTFGSPRVRELATEVSATIRLKRRETSESFKPYLRSE